jgi:cytochrome c-type biogenesis protein
MLTAQISLAAAFFAGVLSFLSPCVLPLVPAYISFMSGVSLEDLHHGDRSDVLRKTILTALAFILGFSIVFVLLGATATAIGKFLLTKFDLISKIAGLVVIVFGLHFLGVFEKYLRFLNYEKRFHVQPRRVGAVGALIVGLAFAFGWTPCVGPILGPILFLAGGQDSVGQGILLLTVYSLGLGIPFLLTAIATHTFLNVFDKMKRHFQVLETISGVFLIIMGVLMFTGQLAVIATRLVEWAPWLARFG